MAELRPGRPARGTTTGRPLLVLFDLLGRRWAMRVLWELRHGALTFRELQAACDQVSPTVLNTRLRELTEAGLIAHHAGEGYQLTRRSRDLGRALGPLQDWADRWAEEL